MILVYSKCVLSVNIPLIAMCLALSTGKYWGKRSTRTNRLPGKALFFVIKESCDYLLLTGDTVVSRLHYTVYSRLRCWVDPKVQASRSVWDHAPTESVLDFNSLKSPFLSFWVLLKNLANFHKIVSTDMDPCLHYSWMQYLTTQKFESMKGVGKFYEQLIKRLRTKCTALWSNLSLTSNNSNYL